MLSILASQKTGIGLCVGMHCWEGGGGKEATVFGSVSAQRGRWILHHLSVQEGHTHKPIPVFWLAPFCGSQGSGSEDIDVQSQCIFIKWCGASARGEGHGGAERQWLPIRFHTQTLRQQDIQANRGWPEATKDQSDTSLHQWSVWDSQKGP